MIYTITSEEFGNLVNALECIAKAIIIAACIKAIFSLITKKG
jgi:hypothetical protein